ncbi:hypothetical protein AAY473_011812 [Plecturocebus cupreus]
MITTHCSLDQPGLGDPPTSATEVVGSTDVHHHTSNILYFIVEMGFCYVTLADMGFCHVGQAGLKLLNSGDLPTLASQSAGITGPNCVIVHMRETVWITQQKLVASGTKVNLKGLSAFPISCLILITCLVLTSSYTAIRSCHDFCSSPAPLAPAWPFASSASAGTGEGVLCSPSNARHTLVLRSSLSLSGSSLQTGIWKPLDQIISKGPFSFNIL